MGNCSSNIFKTNIETIKPIENVNMRTKINKIAQKPEDVKQNLSIIPMKLINWKEHDFNSTLEFSLNNKYLLCRVVDIYDGDTCTCILPLFGNFFKFTVRLAGIDTCEIKSKSEINKELAYKARMELFNYVTNNLGTKKNINLYATRNELRKLLNENIYLVHILCGEFDKYGRLLGWLFDPRFLITNTTESFNQKLIDTKLAYKYEGKTKLTEDDQVLEFTSINL